MQKERIRTLTIAGTCMISAPALGAYISHEFFPYEPPSAQTVEQKHPFPDTSSSLIQKVDVSPTPNKEPEERLAMVDIYACYPINNMLSPDDLPNIDCNLPDSLLHEWIKNQPKSQPNIVFENTTTSDDIGTDAKAFCLEFVKSGKRYFTTSDNPQTELMACYKESHVPVELINPLLSRIQRQEDESALTLEDDAPPPWLWNLSDD